jgi:hypothetical protein
MEIILELIWATTAIAGFVAWCRWRAERGGARSMQLVVLILVTAILFPVISTLDDVWAVQNPAELSSCERRHVSPVVIHGSVPFTMALVGNFPTILIVNDRRFALVISPQSALPQVSVAGVVSTRPPPPAA